MNTLELGPFVSHFHHRVRNGDMNGAKSMLKDGIPVDILGWWDRTALMAAVMGNRPKMVQLLLSHGADPNIKDKIGNTALHYIFFSNDDPRVPRLLLERLDVDVRNNEGETPLMRGIEHSRSHPFGHSLKLTRLLDAGANWHAEDNYGFTPCKMLCDFSTQDFNLSKEFLAKAHAEMQRKKLKESLVYVIKPDPSPRLVKL